MENLTKHMAMLDRFLKCRPGTGISKKYLTQKLVILLKLFKFNIKAVISNVFILLFQKNAITMEVTRISPYGVILVSL